MKKPKSILDPTFKYTPSHATNVRETFKRIRREMAREAPKVNVVALMPKEKAK